MIDNPFDSNIDDKTASIIVKKIYGIIPNLKQVAGELAHDPKLMIRFMPVSGRCEKARTSKGITIKDAAAQLKMP